ncbi:YesL family protein [Halalkalibacter urbisdiaboli]|uniref:YesL family protein n=1 Tax=Halalkalibacter urbisdiaboli TaxID=1960589 RepID=UPI000B43F819|nr:YesL family protein [Halalkalibacter urbisdiaboli]
MEMRGIMGGFYRISIWIARFAYVNVLWVLFTLMGLIIFGFMPATVAVFTITRKWVLGDYEIPVYRTFWMEYKKEFVKSNVIGIVLMLLGIILYINFMFVQEPGTIMLVVRYFLLIVSLFYLVMVLFLFPTYATYELRAPVLLKTALLLGLAYPHYTLFMVVGVLLLQTILMYVPGLIPFFTVSVLSYILMWIGQRVFNQVKKKEEAFEQS